MLMHIINYVIRAMVIMVGILLLSGILLPQNFDSSFINIMGVIFILFGAYRIITYYSQVKRYGTINKRGDENESD